MPTETEPKLITRTSILILCCVLTYSGIAWEVAAAQKFTTSAAALVGIISCLMMVGDVRRRKFRLVRERQRARERLNHRIDRHIKALAPQPHTPHSHSAQLRSDLFLASLISHSRHSRR